MAVNKYRILYKCPMCNTCIKSDKDRNIDQDILPELLAKVWKNQLFAGNPYLYEAPMYIPHKCSNGSAGLAQFIGFEIQQ